MPRTELGGALELRPAGPTLRYDDDVLGATGFDAGSEPPSACRGAVPSLIMLQIIVANDDNYALAA